jgi:transcriptional regulator with XRE-family HTH domain
MDMDTSTLSKIERKDRQVTPAMIPVLARVFKLDYKELQIKFLSQRIKNEYGELDYFTEAIEDLFNQLK